MTNGLKMWGGFVDGRLDIREMDSGFGGWGRKTQLIPAIFTSRARARREYEDVRRLEIRESTNSAALRKDGNG